MRRMAAAGLAAAAVQFALPAAAGSFPTPPRATASTYPDTVLRYDPAWSGGCVPTNPNWIDPVVALGPADYSGGSNGTGAVSLGLGGILEVQFASCFSNSGDSRSDVQLVEVGGFAEACSLALRPAAPTTPADLLDLGLRDANGDGYFEIGRVNGGIVAVDLDALLSRPVPESGLCFDAVQILDDADDHPTCTTTVGADIDAVVAQQAYVGVEPATWGLVKTLYRD